MQPRALDREVGRKQRKEGKGRNERETIGRKKRWCGHEREKGDRVN